MKGIKQYLKTKTDFISFIKKVQDLHPEGGALFYFPDGEGIMVDPIIGIGVKMNLKTRELEIAV